MNSFEKLTQLFREFPGIGTRQAKRFAYFLLARDKKFLDELAKLVSALRKEIGRCEKCFRYFQKAENRIECEICSDKTRDEALLMVVAADTDLAAIEKSGTYRGLYFVLGGMLPLIERKTAEKLRLKEFMNRVSRSVIPAKAGIQRAGLKEVILALSANPDGEHTAFELRRIISPIASAHEITITTLGRGLSTGSEIEYADPETIKSAFKNRSAQNL